MSDKPTYALINGERFETVMVEGTQRFRSNRIIRHMLDAAQLDGGLDLNKLWASYQNGLFTKQEMHELYRLLGVSVCHFGDVFVDDEVETSLELPEASPAPVATPVPGELVIDACGYPAGSCFLTLVQCATAERRISSIEYLHWRMHLRRYVYDVLPNHRGYVQRVCPLGIPIRTTPDVPSEDEIQLWHAPGPMQIWRGDREGPEPNPIYQRPILIAKIVNLEPIPKEAGRC